MLLSHVLELGKRPSAPKPLDQSMNLEALAERD